jgi:Spy/CpxP family protein refolding chaperone
MMKHNLPRLAAVGAALAIGLFASTVDAQGRPQGDDRSSGRAERRDPAQMLERRVSFLTEQLQLSASQQTQVRSILSEEQTAVQALRPRGQARPDSARRDSVRAQMQSIRQRTNERLERVLTAEQRAKHAELQKSMQDRRGGRGGFDRPRGERRGA